MTKIKDILQLDLTEDIKSVIDLQDISENEIQTEIESYIVTDGIGKHLSSFINQYTSNIKETGVWLSGFYGSGKSYFGKMLGYIIDNPMINGTSARDRFLPRLEGVKDQSFIENDILSLDTIKSRVIFLDIAKQNTDNGLAFTLFSNFLKSIGFRDDVLGYYSYHLFIKGKFDEFKQNAIELLGDKWDFDEENFIEAIYKVNLEKYGKSEEITGQIINTYNNNIENFSSGKLKDELERYLIKVPDETLVFIFDEASEAISQKKFTLLDLEAISESISSISKKVWTIAIAQEKLDDVINNANVSKSNLTKVTDRFKTKIHLESTEVDVIIRKRLLLKKETAYNDLISYFKKHEGLISNATNLKSSFPTKTIDQDQFATYYPFHKYQFELLQKFLFSSNALVSNQIAARGMIITTFDVLRKELNGKNKELYDFTTAYDLCTEAQTSPPADLVSKYSNAKAITEKAGLNTDGEKILKTIHFINEAELVFPTLENITKTFISDISSYYSVKPEIEKALELFIDAKLLLVSNNNYKITSDLEGKLLEEMNDFEVELFVKKRELVTYLKKLSIFRKVAVINDDAVAYNFNILTDLDDEIIGSSNKNLKLTVYSLFNINENRQDFIEGLRMDTQYSKDVITLVPDNNKFTEIDRLLEEVKRYAYMEEKYSNDSDDKKRQIIREFSTIKDEKEKDLVNLILEAYTNGSLIYLFDESYLNEDNFKGSVNEVQRKLIKNIYTKRLKSQLSENVGHRILNENNSTKLGRYFSGDEFKFFDANGNFIGEHLKVIEEIKSKIKSYIDGKSLEQELSMAPWGYSYGTISTVLAVLFRAGRLVIKYNDTEYFSYKDKPAHEVFTSGAKFKNARFKAISKTLSASQKNQLVQILLDLDFEKHTGKKIDWTSSDFELADSITYLADKFITSVNTLKNTMPDFTTLFKNLCDQKNILQQYTSKTTEANYLRKAEDFLIAKDDFVKAIKTIVKGEKFIKRNLNNLKGYRRFVNSVNDELHKAGIINETVIAQTELFNNAIKDDIINRFADIKNAAQKIRDEYYELMTANAGIMKAKYDSLASSIREAQTDLNTNYPAELNKDNIHKLNTLLIYCKNKMIDGVRLEYQIECQDSKFSLSDILNYIDLAPTKETELQMILGNFVKEAPKPPEPGKKKEPKKIQLTITKSVMTTKEYRNLLASQLQAMAGMDNEEEIEVKVVSTNH